MSNWKNPAILNDTTLCTGCQTCVKACKTENDLGKDRLMPEQRRIDDLSPARYTTIVQEPGKHFVRLQCRHCLEPACASACPVAALHRTPEGPVVCDYSRCLGCRYCFLACPFGIPRYEWDSAVPYMRKCTMCLPRIKEGKQPACTEACPYGATIFGEREELIAVAQDRIDQNPEKYRNHIFGQTEVGGTSVLHISDIPLDFLAWSPNLGNEKLSNFTWSILGKTPWIAGVMGSMMLGAYWAIGRRMRMAAAPAESGQTREAGGKDSER